MERKSLTEYSVVFLVESKKVNNNNDNKLNTSQKGFSCRYYKHNSKSEILRKG